MSACACPCANHPGAAVCGCTQHPSPSRPVLTHRVYLAGQALAAIIAHAPDRWSRKDIAEDAVAYADAVIAELEKAK
jgi:hypothetical protein